MRIAFVCDPNLDADARCACSIISTLPGVGSKWIELSETTTPILLREFSKLIRHRNEIDLLITAGRHASSIGKFWPARWLDIGTTNHRGHVRPAKIGLSLEPVNIDRAVDRAIARTKLGVSETDRLIYAPGRPTYRSHFAAFHTTSILHISDPRYRLLVEQADQNWLESMAQKLEQSRLLANHSDLTESNLARAADVVLFAPGANPPRVPVARAISLKIPLVAAHNRYTNWLAEIIDRIDPPKPRLLAKAIMRVFDHRINEPQLILARDWIERRFDPNRAMLAWTNELATMLSRLKLRQPNKT